MSEFTKELPARVGFYLVKNTNFEMAAELINDPEVGLLWNTTELSQIEYQGFLKGTEYKRVLFSAPQNEKG